MKLSHLALALLLACSSYVAAEPSPPSLGVLVVDSQRHWDPETQAHYAGSPTDWKSLLQSKAVSRLSYQQRQALLRDPARLLASSRASQIFTVDRVLVLEPSLEDRVLATWVDLSTHQSRRLISPRDVSGEAGRQALIAQATEEGRPEGTAVASHSPVPPGAPMLAFDDLERELGHTLAQQVESQYPILLDPVRNERVQRVGARLVERNGMQAQGYRFVVLDTDVVNAFAVPTGPFYVTRGLLDVIETDAELATVMGHELSHAELHHSRKQYEQAQQLSWLTLLATVATGSNWAGSATNFFGLLVSRGYSREFEMDADRQGVWMAYGAGYDPEDFRLTLQRFKDLEKARGGGGGIAWFRTHPGNDDRIEQLNGIIDRLEPLGLLLEEVAPADPGLAAYLRAHGSEFLENPVELTQFLSAYRSLSLVQ